MDVMEFRGTFRIGEKEAVDFYVYEAKRKRLGGVIGFGIIGLLVCYLYGRSVIESAVLLAGAMALSFAAAAAVTVLCSYLSIRIKVKSAMKKNNTADYDQSILVNGYGVRTEANGRDVRIGFDKVVAVRETKKAFYIYLGKEHAWIVPKAQMEDEAAGSAMLRKIFNTVIESKNLHLLK